MMVITMSPQEYEHQIGKQPSKMLRRRNQQIRLLGTKTKVDSNLSDYPLHSSYYYYRNTVIAALDHVFSTMLTSFDFVETSAEMPSIYLFQYTNHPPTLQVYLLTEEHGILTPHCIFQAMSTPAFFEIFEATSQEKFERAIRQHFSIHNRTLFVRQGNQLLCYPEQQQTDCHNWHEIHNLQELSKHTLVDSTQSHYFHYGSATLALANASLDSMQDFPLSLYDPSETWFAYDFSHHQVLPHSDSLLQITFWSEQDHEWKNLSGPAEYLRTSDSLSDYLKIYPLDHHAKLVVFKTTKTNFCLTFSNSSWDSRLHEQFVNHAPNDIIPAVLVLSEGNVLKELFLCATVQEALGKGTFILKLPYGPGSYGELILYRPTHDNWAIDFDQSFFDYHYDTVYQLPQKNRRCQVKKASLQLMRAITDYDNDMVQISL